MKLKLLNFFTVLLLCVHVHAQSFYGVVKKNDSLSSPIFQAKVEVAEGDKSFASLKTYFDGGYKFTVNKNQSYIVKISYAGYTDTTFTIKTDKNAKPFPEYMAVRLKKDGMRLLGVLRSREESFPIKEAAITLKNVMTKKEEHITTGIDGAYNFKLEYETNYKVSVDKRSAGILNLFKDTSFYVSTIGFNQPLDYKLDIFLDPVLFVSNADKERYASAKESVSANAKILAEKAKQEKTKQETATASVEAKQPFVEDKKQKATDETVSKLQQELEETKKELDALKQKEEDRKKSSSGVSFSSSNRKKEKEDPNLEVVVIRDEVVKKTNAEAQALNEAEIKKLQAQAEQKSLAIEKEIQKQKAEEKTIRAKSKAEELADMQNAFEDSVERERNKQDAQLMALAAHSKQEWNDSVAKQKAKEEAEARAKAEQEQAAKNVAIKKGDEDSIKKATVALRLNFIQDSIAKAKVEQQQKATTLAAKKASDDSMKKVVHLLFVKDSIQRVAEKLAKKAEQDSVKKVLAAERAKFVLDSTTQVKAEQQRKAKVLAAEKLADDSAKQLGRLAFVKDSVQRVAEKLAKKAEQDSVKKVLAAERAKFVLDSTTQVKAEQQRKAKELASKKQFDDSIKKVVAFARTMFIADSIANAKVQAKLKARNDSIATAKAKATHLNSIDLLDSALAAWGGTLSASKIEARKKFVADSIVRAKAEQIRVAKELALQKAKEDSVKRAEELVRVKFVKDSTTQVRAEQTRIARETAARKAEQDSLSKIVLVARAKFILDSTNQVKAASEAVRKEKLAVEKKRLTDSIAVVAHHKEELRIARVKAQEDSLQTVKAEKEKKAQEAKQAAEAKAREAEELKASQVNEATRRLDAEEAARNKKVFDDSLVAMRGEREKMEREVALAKQKAKEEEAKRLAAEASIQQLKEAETARVAQEKKANEEAATQKAFADAKTTTEKQIAERKVKEENAKRVEAEAQKIREAEGARAEQERKTNEEAVMQKAIADARAITEKQLAEQKEKEENAKRVETQAQTKTETIAPIGEVKDPIANNIISAELPAVGFDKNSFDLSPDFKAELKKTVSEMLTHPETRINIYAIASVDETNPKQVSLKRSDAVLRYLIDNGVSIERVNSFYYGNTNSRNGCVNQNCPKNLMRQNRSVSYQLTKPN